MVRGHATTTTTVTTYCKPTNLKSNEWEENGFLSLGSSQVPTKQLTSESCGGAGLGWPGLGTCLFVCLCWKQLLIMVIVSLGHTDRSGYRGEGRAAAATSIIMASPGLSCPPVLGQNISILGNSQHPAESPRRWLAGTTVVLL